MIFDFVFLFEKIEFWNKTRFLLLFNKKTRWFWLKSKFYVFFGTLQEAQCLQEVMKDLQSMQEILQD